MSVSGGVIVLLDQASKWMVGRMNPSIFQINSGISFGIFASPSGVQSGWKVMLLILLAIGIVASFRQLWKKYPLWFGFFLGGGVSNFIDRVIWGGVRDWLPIPLLSLQNNLADWAIVVGIAMMLFQEFRIIQWLQKKAG